MLLLLISLIAAQPDADFPSKKPAPIAAPKAIPKPSSKPMMLPPKPSASPPIVLAKTGPRVPVQAPETSVKLTATAPVNSTKHGPRPQPLATVKTSAWEPTGEPKSGPRIELAVDIKTASKGAGSIPTLALKPSLVGGPVEYPFGKVGPVLPTSARFRVTTTDDAVIWIHNGYVDQKMTQTGPARLFHVDWLRAGGEYTFRFTAIIDGGRVSRSVTFRAGECSWVELLPGK